MSSAFVDQKMFWDEQLSIARAVAHQPEPSLAKLHHDILEEVGQRPGLELIEYFLGLVEIPEEEKEEYLRYAGFPSLKKEVVVEAEAPPKSKATPALLLADTVATGDSPTVLAFRQTYTAEYGEAPSGPLIEYFLKKVQHVQQKKKNRDSVGSGGGEEEKRIFAEKTASGSHPTVLRLRKGYAARFGGVPSDELIRYFLETLRGKSGTVALDPSERVAGIPDSRVVFAKSAAKRNVATILQFGKIYEKLYGESPAIELIDVFIKNLPKASDETLFESTDTLLS